MNFNIEQLVSLLLSDVRDNCREADQAFGGDGALERKVRQAMLETVAAAAPDDAKQAGLPSEAMRTVFYAAFNWNDHNCKVDALLGACRRIAKSVGVESFDEANEWLAQATDDGKGQPVAVREGESLWLIEQTGKDGVRRFWAGYFWTTSALEAVRFVKYSDAHSLVCRPFWKNFSNAHPDEHEPVEVCEHLFQCGVSAPQGWQQGAAKEILDEAYIENGLEVIGIAADPVCMKALTERIEAILKRWEGKA